MTSDCATDESLPNLASPSSLLCLGLFLPGSRHVADRVVKPERNERGLDGRMEETTGTLLIASDDL